jgi:two-component system response regulator AtoC
MRRRVLVVDDDETVRQSVQLALRGRGYEASGVALDGAPRALAAGRFDFLSLRLPGAAPLAPGPAAGPVARLAAAALGARVVAVLPAGAGAAAGLAAMAAGAHDFVVVAEGGDLPAALALAFDKAAARAAAPPPLQAPGDAARAAPAIVSAIVGESARLGALLAAVRRVAPFKTTVLVRGESGTGKELVARALHAQSPRAAGPFVAVNCGAIPGPLLESELFGHRRGAFTDAHRDRTGLLEQASGGTLFLDEIAELPLELQVKLLRVLEEDRVRRLGDAEETAVDVRLVAATARDLEGEVAAGRFRADLFHRLDVVTLRLPPLRERPGDIPLLAAHFAQRVGARLGLGVRTVGADAMKALATYRWPGNVRELENTIERAAVMCDGPEIDAASLPERVRGASPAAPDAPPDGPSVKNGLQNCADADDLSMKRVGRRLEEDLIRRALARTGGNRTRAAALLEISHRALLYKIKHYRMFPKPDDPDGDPRP